MGSVGVNCIEEMRKETKERKSSNGQIDASCDRSQCVTTFFIQAQITDIGGFFLGGNEHTNIWMDGRKRTQLRFPGGQIDVSNDASIRFFPRFFFNGN